VNDNRRCSCPQKTEKKKPKKHERSFECSPVLNATTCTTFKYQLHFP
jgi:hypothetical protein